MIYTHTLTISTRGNTDVTDITSEISHMVADSGIANGIACLFCASSTSGITTIEYEPGAVSDLKRAFEELIPSNRDYAHNAAWQDGNGHSHVRAAMLGASLTIPIIEGRLSLGIWQQVVHVDFDVRPRRREIIVQIIGG